MIRPLFSVGTSRGGTTFFARMVSMNRNAKMASDPFLPLFRSLRSALVRQEMDPAFDDREPLGDPYFTARGVAIMDVIQRGHLDLAIPEGEWDALRPALEARMGLAATEVIPFLGDLHGSTYREAFASGLDILAHAYGATSGWVGFNDNWVIEFLPLLARAFPDAKCCVIIRDPRAAMASSMKLRDNDPAKAAKVPLMYSFAHHWRKHAAFAWMLQRNPEVAGRFVILRYEDLVQSPEEQLARLCTFLEIAYDPRMIDTGQFRPLRGGMWQGHSNFSVPARGIYTESVAAWKSYLDRATIEWIEFVCHPEMRLFGYMSEQYTGGMPTAGVMDFFRTDDARAVGWRNTHARWDLELARELMRTHALALPSGFLSEAATRESFLFPGLYEALRAV